MVNKNYVKGRAFEYKIKKYYEDLGFKVFRCAGSHSPADLIAIKKDMKPCFIQCKNAKRIDKKEYESFILFCKELNVQPVWINKIDKKKN